jgi:galactokinase/mevalonate kinase-like predicted kinase
VVSIAEAIRKGSWGDFNRSVELSWVLNQQLDKGTNPEAIQNIINPVNDLLLSKKLLGAGGGGYILMIAKDPEAAGKIRSHFNTYPPNDKARFVEMQLSEVGLSVTKS